MNALITCEFSGEASGAFRELGHNALSCDKLPSEAATPHHRQCDALQAIREPWYDGQRWDLIGIHYTCTFFCNSGVQWLYLPRTDGNRGRSKDIDPARWAKMEAAADELAALWVAAVATGAKVYFENPVMHRHAKEALVKRIPDWRPNPTQIIQPCDFGHPETKATGLWLHGLPPLKPTKIVRNEMALLTKGERSRVHYASPGPDRWKNRSRTLPGIAKAMAEQWGGNAL